MTDTCTQTTYFHYSFTTVFITFIYYNNFSIIFFVVGISVAFPPLRHLGWKDSISFHIMLWCCYHISFPIDTPIFPLTYCVIYNDPSIFCCSYEISLSLSLSLATLYNSICIRRKCIFDWAIAFGFSFIILIRISSNNSCFAYFFLLCCGIFEIIQILAYQIEKCWCILYWNA